MSENINTKEAEAKAEAVKGKVVTIPKGVKPNYIYYLPIGEDEASEAVKYTIHAKDASEEAKAEAVAFFIDKGVNVYAWSTTTKQTSEAKAKADEALQAEADKAKAEADKAKAEADDEADNTEAVDELIRLADEAQAKADEAKASKPKTIDVTYYSVKLADYEKHEKPKATRQSVAEAKAEAVRAQIDAIEALQADGLTLAEVLAKLKAEALGIKAEA